MGCRLLLRLEFVITGLLTKSILLPYAYTAYPMAGEDTVTDISSQSWPLITSPKTSIFSQSPFQL